MQLEVNRTVQRLNMAGTTGEKGRQPLKTVARSTERARESIKLCLTTSEA